MAMLHTGLGLFVNDPCRDKDRPFWMPPWMDTSTEAACLVHSSTLSTGLVPPPAPAAPETMEEMTSWTPDDIYLAQRAQWEEWKTTNRQLMSYDPEGTKPPSSEFGAWWAENKWFALAGGLGLYALAFTGRR